MKIVFAIKCLDNMAGGAERVLLQIIQGLKDNFDYDITLITFDKQEAKSFYPVPEGLDWIKLGVGDSTKPANFIDTFRRILKLREVINNISPDVIIPFQHSMFIPMAFATLGSSIRMFASEHTVPHHYKSRPLEYLLFLITSFCYKKITVLSDKIIGMHPRFIRGRMIAIPNPILILEQEADIKGGIRKILLSVGRLEPQKDQDTLISAFSLIVDKVPDWDLEIVGEGKLREALEKKISDLGLIDRIFLSGATTEIMKKYERSQAFVLASRYESFGLATAEAMSSGLPVIGFADCAGTNELISHDKDGLLAKIEENELREESLSKTLLKVMTDEDLRFRLGQQGRLKMKQFSLSKIIQKWNHLILNL